MTIQGARKFVWSQIQKDNVTPMITRQIVTGAAAMAGLINLTKGAYVPRHSHESEQLTYVFNGSLRLIVADQEFVVNAGEIVVIPAWVDHEAVALEDTLELDIFSPIRKDWLDGTDTYFQKGIAGPPAEKTDL
jgi:quercetin dioxygenase-like cupin family protein